MCPLTCIDASQRSVTVDSGKCYFAAHNPSVEGSIPSGPTSSTQGYLQRLVRGPLSLSGRRVKIMSATSTSEERMPNLFEVAGGEEGIHRLEARFYALVLADDLLQPLFGTGQPQH